MDEEDEVRYALVMPFVVCQSQGGPYDDDSFVAGYELGELDRFLRTLPIEVPVVEWVVRQKSMPQVELIAMKNGWSVERNVESEGEDTEWSDEWACLIFRRSGTVDDIANYQPPHFDDEL